MKRLVRFINLMKRNNKNKLVIVVPNSAKEPSSDITQTLWLVIHFISNEMLNLQNLLVVTVDELSRTEAVNMFGCSLPFTTKSLDSFTDINSELWTFESHVTETPLGMYAYWDVEIKCNLYFLSNDIPISSNRQFRVLSFSTTLDPISISLFMRDLGISFQFISSALNLLEEVLKLGWNIEQFKLTPEEENNVDEML